MSDGFSGNNNDVWSYSRWVVAEFL